MRQIPQCKLIISFFAPLFSIAIFILLMCIFFSSALGLSLDKALTQKQMLGTWRIMEVRIDGVKLKGIDKNYSYMRFSPSEINTQGRYLASIGCDQIFGRFQLLEIGYMVINRGGNIPNSCSGNLERNKVMQTQLEFMQYLFGRFKMKQQDGFFLIENPRLQIWMIPFVS